MRGEENYGLCMTCEKSKATVVKWDNYWHPVKYSYSPCDESGNDVCPEACDMYEPNVFARVADALAKRVVEAYDSGELSGSEIMRCFR
jgi:hypothetical protein